MLTHYCYSFYIVPIVLTFIAAFYTLSWPHTSSNLLLVNEQDARLNSKLAFCDSKSEATEMLFIAVVETRILCCFYDILYIIYFL